MANCQSYSKECVLGWVVSTGSIENMCLENKEGLQTQRSEEIPEAFTTSLLQILHTNQELVSKKQKTKLAYAVLCEDGEQNS